MDVREPVRLVNAATSDAAVMKGQRNKLKRATVRNERQVESLYGNGQQVSAAGAAEAAPNEVESYSRRRDEQTQKVAKGAMKERVHAKSMI